MSADLARRAAASRKGWDSRRRQAAARGERREAEALRVALAGGPPIPAPEWGGNPLPREDMSIPGILARIKARESQA